MRRFIQPQSRRNTIGGNRQAHPNPAGNQSTKGNPAANMPVMISGHVIRLYVTRALLSSSLRA